MKLAEWVAQEISRQETHKTNVLKKLSEDSGVSLVTLQSVTKGMPLTLYPKARAISEATNGEVTVKELCE